VVFVFVRLSFMVVIGKPKTTAPYFLVTGRVGRRPDERPGLILMLYNPSKARDLSHFEQFHSYHRRLYERVEPTSVTPFTISAIQRALGGMIVTWLRQSLTDNDHKFNEESFDPAIALIRKRAKKLLGDNGWNKVKQLFEKEAKKIQKKWDRSHNDWHFWNLTDSDSPVYRRYDQYATGNQIAYSFPVPLSLRQVNQGGETTITSIKLGDLNQA
jgi:hypothetical protein